MSWKFFGVVASLFLLVAVLLPSTTSADDRRFYGPFPVIFVHGSSGSGAQFESQAMRFSSNGYSQSYLGVYEYDSTYTLNTNDDIYAGIDAKIADVMATTGARQVDLVGHSMGTVILADYLNSSKERAANVAHYVSIDGEWGINPPGGVPTLALWAGTGDPGRQINFAKNVTIPNQTHVQTATSPESFAEMFRFLTGRGASTLGITPEDPSRVKLAGRAVIFPQNSGVQNANLEIWQVDDSTGARIGSKPVAVYPLSGDGSWGPFAANGTYHYELAIVRAGAPTHHFYFEPFERSDYFIRLNTNDPGTGLDALVDLSDHQTDLVITRYKELWGDQPGQNDALTIDGTNVVNAATCPVAQRVNALFAYDKGSDGVSDVSAPIASLFAIRFITGVDLFIPATVPPSGTVTVALTPRDGGGRMQTLNVPNWSSLTDRVSIQFKDYLPPATMRHDMDRWWWWF